MASTATLKMLLLGEDRSASKALKGVGSEADKSAGHLKGFGKVAGVALVAAAAAAVAFGKSSVDAYKTAAAESGTLARTTGATLEQASQLRFAATQTGVSFASLSKGMQTFGKNLGGAAGDAKKSADMVKKLGFSFKDAKGNVKPVADLLPQLADKFKNMADGPAKTALAMKLFGKGGVDMIKTLNKGSEGLRDLAAQSDKTGNTLKNTDAVKAQMKAQREFSGAVAGLKIQLGQALMPILTAVALFLTAHVAPAFTKVSGFVSTHQHLIATLVPVVFGLASAMGAIALAMKVWSGVTKVASAVAKTFAAVQWLVNAAMSANPIGLVVLAIVGLVAALVIAYKKSDTFRSIVQAAFHGVVVAVQEVGKIGLWLWNNVYQPVFKFIIEGIANVLRFFGNLLEKIGHVPGFGWVGDLGRAMQGAADSTQNLANKIKKIPTHKNVDLNVAVHYTAETAPVGANSTRGFNIGANANGTTYWRGGLTWVGERGPEVVNLPRGSSVTPAGQPARLAADGGGGDIHVTINGALDPIAVGKQVQQALLKVKRANGGKSLGLA